jgi:hypothetical protein
MGTFLARIDHLSEEVGSGQLVARCEVDQPYAQDQHENLKGAMIDIAEEMSGYVATYAPVLTGALRTSGHPEVTDNGMKIYDRPPISARERG